MAEPEKAAEEKIEVKGDSTQAMGGDKKFLQPKELVGLLSVFNFLLSLPLLFSIIWLLYTKEYDCERILRLPKLQIEIGIGLIFVFSTSNLVVLLRSKYPMPGLLLILVPLILMFIIGLAIVGANRTESHNIPASPMWLRSKTYDNDNWDDIKSCIYNTRTCDNMVLRLEVLKSYDLGMRGLSSMEGGCCKPPTICGMEFVNASFWTRKDGGNDSDDNDCNLWQNERDVLCYNCRSCKEGFISTLHSKWWKLAREELNVGVDLESPTIGIGIGAGNFGSRGMDLEIRVKF